MQKKILLVSLLAVVTQPLAARERSRPKPAASPDLSETKPKKVGIGEFTLPDDLEMTVWATSPMFYNPTNMDTDAAGRIYVAEGVNYRHHETRRPEGDRIMILEDTDADGVADSSHCFVQEKALIAPLGVSVFDNKIVVAQPPSIIVYTDIDRDLKFDPAVDHREEILTGFNARNHDHSLHATTAGPDGKWYFNQGNCGALITGKDGKTFRLGGSYYNNGAGTPHWFNNPNTYAGEPSDDGEVWVSGAIGKMNPDGSAIEIFAHGMRNSYEHCHSSFGDLFQNDNDDMVGCRNTWLMEGGFLGYFSKDGKRGWLSDRRPGQDIPTAHWRQEDPGSLPPGDIYGSGSPTGIAFYENGALPGKYAGSILSCEARQRVIFSYKPDYGRGAAVGMGERSDFLSSEENVLFRPSDVMVGADGALYVADWFDNIVGGHKDNDESRSGTIYRIAPKGFEPRIATRGGDPIELLRSPATHVRNTGFEALKAAGETALPEVEALLADGDKWIAARAVWLLPFLGEKGAAACRERLTHPDADQRILAFRSLRNSGTDVLAMAGEIVDDPSPAVRRELATALRSVAPKDKFDLVVRLFEQAGPGEDRTYLEACGLAAKGIEAEVWDALKGNGGIPLEWSNAFTMATWRLLPEAAVPALVERAKARSLTAAQRRIAFDTLAFIGNREAVMAVIDFAGGSDPGLAEQANWWLLTHGLMGWAQYGTEEILKERGIYDAGAIVLQNIVAQDAPKKTKLPPPAEIAALTGDAEQGKLLSGSCIMCHKIDGIGAAFGPDLIGWVKDQGPEAFAGALTLPSSGIAHGYGATRLILKEGGQIDGILQSRDDPLIIDSIGGLRQIVPRDRIEKIVNRRWKSLMPSAEQLGLNAQNIADLAAFLGGYNSDRSAAAK